MFDKRSDNRQQLILKSHFNFAHFANATGTETDNRMTDTKKVCLKVFIWEILHRNSCIVSLNFVSIFPHAQTILNAVLRVTMLLRMCHCLTVYNLNQSQSEIFDDGTYQPAEHKHDDDAFYQFGYKVNAIETGDIKQHVEKRVNNEVKGAYFLIEPNGVGRLVEYIANENGFNAVVRHQYGAKYSKNFEANNKPQNDPFRQAFDTRILNESKTNNEENLPQRQKVAFDSFRKEQNDEHKRQPYVTYRQSSPKSITNQSSIFSLLKNSTEKFEMLSNSAVAQTPTTTPTSKRPAIGRRRQYEVFDPEVDIDIRRSVPKLFLNLDKLKQSRKE